MTNPMKGEMTIELAGESHPCRLTVDSLKRIETDLDTGVLLLTQRIANSDIRVNDLAVVLYYALRGGGNNLSQADINKIIASAGIVPVCKAVADLLVGVLSDPEAEEGEKKPLET